MTTLITAATVQQGNCRRQIHAPRRNMLLLAALIAVTSVIFGCGGAVSTTAVQAPGVPASSGTAHLAWSAPSTNVDGTPLTSLAGFKIYYGVTPGVYTAVVVGNVSSYQVVGLTKGQTYYFSVTAYDAAGNESDYAPVVSKLVS